MNIPDRLNEETRRNVYAFVLSLYELSGSLRDPGVLVRDIEVLGNKILGLVAKFPTVDVKDKFIKDILGELKSLRALIGLLRDTGKVSRERIKPIWDDEAKLETSFEELLQSAKEAKPIPQPLPQMFPKEILENVSRKKSEAPIEMTPVPQPELSQFSRGLNRERQDVSLRQTAILEVLKRRTQVTVGELGVLFSGKVSKKTIQRDLQDLADRHVVKRTGDKRWASYSLNT